MRIISACCRKPDSCDRNRTSLSIQQAEHRKKTFFMAALCTGHHAGAGENSGGYAAEQLTDWFWQEFVSTAAKGRRQVMKSLSGQLARIHQKIQKYEALPAGTDRIHRGGVSVEAVFLYNRHLYYVHTGNGSCCRIRNRRTIYLSRPHVIGDGILLRNLGGCVQADPDILSARLKKKESLLLGAHYFPGRFSKRELARLWRPDMAAEEKTALLRLEEMCLKRIRQGEKTEQAVIVVIMDA